MKDGRKVSVVLGGGGMKGLAHIGALKVLHRWGLVPDEYVGTSVGSYIAAMAAGGMPLAEMELVALSIRQEDLRSLAVIYDETPSQLTEQLIGWGVLNAEARRAIELPA